MKLFEKNTNPTLKIPIVTLNIMKYRINVIIRIEFAIIDRIIELLRVIPTISDINLPFQLTTKKENIKPKFSLNTTKKPVVTKPKNVSTLKKEIKPVLDKSKSTVNKKSVNTSKNLFTLSILDTTNNSTDLSNTTNESSIKVGLDKKNIESNNTVNTPPLNMKNLYSKQIIESLSKAKNYTYNVPLNQSIPLSPFLSSSFDKNNEDVEIQAIPFSPPKILHNSLKENGSKPQFCDSPMQIKKEEVNSNTSFELSNSSKEILKNANSSGGNNYLSNSFESKFINLNPPSFNLSSITALDTNSIK